MAAAGRLSDQQLQQAAPYMGSRRILADIVRAGSRFDCSDSHADAILKDIQESKAATPQQPTPRETARSIFVVGGDYFSASQYTEVRRPDDGIFSGFATSEREDLPAEQEEGGFDLCTETLAVIYAEQGYYEEAKQIYSELSLRYPEKSVYFASLIEKIDKKQI